MVNKVVVGEEVKFLFQPSIFGDVEMKNRILMAPSYEGLFSSLKINFF